MPYPYFAMAVAFAVELPPLWDMYDMGPRVFEKVLRQPLACVVNLRALRLKAFAYVLVQASALFFGPFPHFLDDFRWY
jgi:hypothetical protein